MNMDWEFTIVAYLESTQAEENKWSRSVFPVVMTGTLG